MKNLLPIELYKLRTTPAAWVSLVVTLGLALAATAVNILVDDATHLPLGSTDHVNKALSSASLTSMVMLALGVLVIAGEYRHRTIMQAYLAQPRRGLVLAAKLGVAGVVGAALGGLTFGLTYVEALVLYGSRGVHSLPIDVPRLWVGATLASALYGLLGVALGALTRNTVAAIVGGIAWAMVIEAGILVNVVPDLAKWLPAGAATALTTTSDSGGALLAPGVAAAVLVGWGLLLSGIAARFTLSREIH